MKDLMKSPTGSSTSSKHRKIIQKQKKSPPSEESDEDCEMIDTRAPAEPIASRREKRQRQELYTPDSRTSLKTKEQATKKRKCTDNGWYRVEGITGHRINTDGKRPKLELRVKWEGYSEQTWEAFDGFVKDTAPMVERYLVRSVLKPLEDLQDEIKQLKKEQNLRSSSSDSPHPTVTHSEENTFNSIMQSRPLDNLSSIYELVDSLRSSLARGHDMPHAVQLKLSEFYLETEKTNLVWKHVLLLLGKRRRNQFGVIQVCATAINMKSNAKIDLVLDDQIISTQDIPKMLEVLASKGATLAEDI